MITLSAELLAAQKLAGRRPYRKAVFTFGVNTYTYDTQGGANALVGFTHNEAAYGGSTVIRIKNQNQAFSALNLRGYEVTLSFGFENADRSIIGTVDRAPLYVLRQRDISVPGALFTDFHCINQWARMAGKGLKTAGKVLTGTISTDGNDIVIGETVTGSNSGATGLLCAIEDSNIVVIVKSGTFEVAENVTGTGITCSSITGIADAPLAAGAGWNKTHTISQILTSVTSGTVDGITLDSDDPDNTITTYQPFLFLPLNTRVRGVVKQLFDMSKCAGLIKNDNNLHIKYLDPAAATDYSYGSDHVFFQDNRDQSLIVPNTITYVDRLPDIEHGNRPQYSGTATNTDSVDRLGTFEEIYEDPTIESDVEAAARATAAIAQLVAQANQGAFEAPCNIGQEVYDMVAAVDTRLGATVTGRVGSISFIFDIERGIDVVQISLGGLVSLVSDIGLGAIGKEWDIKDLVEPREVPPVQTPASPWSIPAAIQGFQHDITFSATDWDTVAWTSGTVKFYDGSTQATDSGNTGDLADGDIRYVYFDLDTDPTVLKVTTDYLSVMTTRTGVLAVIQRGSDSSVKATIIPSSGKLPLVTADVIYLTGLLDKLPDGTYGKVLSTDISAGHILLSSASGSLDNIADGSSYKKVLATDISAGHILLSSVTQSASYRTTSDTEKSTWNGKPNNMDDIPAGSTYSKVLTTDISAGHILLSSVVQSASYRTTSDAEKSTWNGKPDDMDELGDGSTYKKVLATDISAGHIKLTSNTVWSGKVSVLSGVTIDSASGINIFGINNGLTTRATEAGTIQCSVNSSGQITAGGGNVILDANGITIDDYSRLILKYSGTIQGRLGGSASGLLLSSVTGIPLYITCTGNSSNILYLSGQGGIQIAGTVYPGSDGVPSLGTSAKKWASVYSNAYYIGTTQGTTNTVSLLDENGVDSHTLTVSGGIVTGLT